MTRVVEIAHNRKARSEESNHELIKLMEFGSERRLKIVTMYPAHCNKWIISLYELNIALLPLLLCNSGGLTLKYGPLVTIIFRCYCGKRSVNRTGYTL